MVSEPHAGDRLFEAHLVRRSVIVNQRFGITVKFLISADSPEEAEEIIESACEKMAASIHEGDVSYEGIEDIEEEDE